MNQSQLPLSQVPSTCTTDADNNGGVRMLAKPIQNPNRGDQQRAMRQRLAQLQSTMNGDTPEANGDSSETATREAPQPDAASVTQPYRHAVWFAFAGLFVLGLVAGFWMLGQVSSSAIALDRSAVQTNGPAASMVQVAPREPDPSLTSVDSDQAIRDTLERWRLDWSRRDVTAYLAHYSSRFEPAGGLARNEWEAQRSRNLLNRPAIRVEIKDLHIDYPKAGEAQVNFLQTYLSGRYQELEQPKTLLLVEEGQAWRIAGEAQGTREAKSALPR